ncbi:MAG: BlaI/MecI/CopY family transcriptional regulator [Victivallaceae bacterium]|nr:BlaI/MecI/CopY family transcriptional regulator [Victivallaceae bacterium]
MKTKQISDAELEVMKVLWRKSPLASPEIVREVQKNNVWSVTTVVTLLGRLVKKGAVRQEGVRRAYLYTPITSKDDYTDTAAEIFKRNAFAGSAAELLSFFVKRDKLTKNDISELRKYLDEIEKRSE